VAKNDVRPLRPNDIPCITFRTEAAATAIYAGEPVKIGGTGSNYVVPLADAEPTTSADIMGIAASDSTQTASANGTVDVYLAVSDAVFECKAKTATTFDTDAEILAVLNDIVPFDLTSSTYTIDVAAAAGTNGLRIVGGDPATQMVQFMILAQASSLNT
jgi:hypothetical protein